MKRLIAVLLLVSVLGLAAAKVSEAFQPGRFGPRNVCGFFDRGPSILGQAFAPFEVSATGGVKCITRVPYIKFTACIVRYGSSHDQQPKIGNCKSGMTVFDDQIGFTVRYKCHYTTFDYLWILEMHAIVRGVTGRKGAGTGVGWPIETRCF